MNICPCGSGQPYDACCRPRHDGSRPAETAEALMRSRYAAFALALGEYILATQAPELEKQTAEEISAWARGVKWHGLRVVRAERGGPNDARGIVEFEATFEEGGQTVTQHEVSRFDRVQGRWRYLEGKRR